MRRDLGVGGAGCRGQLQSAFLCFFISLLFYAFLYFSFGLQVLFFTDFGNLSIKW